MLSSSVHTVGAGHNTVNTPALARMHTPARTRVVLHSKLLWVKQQYWCEDSTRHSVGLKAAQSYTTHARCSADEPASAHRRQNYRQCVKHRHSTHTHTAYSTSCRSSTEPATAAAKPVVATDALLRLGSGLGDALGVVAGASAALMPVVALAAIVALAVALRLAATAEAVAFLTAPATVVAFLRPVGATGSSVAVALRLAGWAVATPVLQR